MIKKVVLSLVLSFAVFVSLFSTAMASVKSKETTHAPLSYSCSGIYGCEAYAIWPGAVDGAAFSFILNNVQMSNTGSGDIQEFVQVEDHTTQACKQNNNYGFCFIRAGLIRKSNDCERWYFADLRPVDIGSNVNYHLYNCLQPGDYTHEFSTTIDLGTSQLHNSWNVYSSGLNSGDHSAQSTNNQMYPGYIHQGLTVNGTDGASLGNSNNQQLSTWYSTSNNSSHLQTSDPSVHITIPPYMDVISFPSSTPGGSFDVCTGSGSC